VSKSVSSVIIAPRVLLGQGIASLLQGSRYKVVAIAAEPSELPSGCCTQGPALAIVGMNGQDANLNKAGEGIRLLRTLMLGSKVVLVIETNGPFDLRRVLALAPDACIFKLGSRDTLLNVLELALTDQRAFVFDKSIATTAKGDDASLPLDSFRLGVNAQAMLSPRQHEILSYLARGK
jgi:DNA-binding NarL/FixJ family response regulator